MLPSRLLHTPGKCCRQARAQTSRPHDYWAKLNRKYRYHSHWSPCSRLLSSYRSAKESFATTNNKGGLKRSLFTLFCQRRIPHHDEPCIRTQKEVIIYPRFRMSSNRTATVEISPPLRPHATRIRLHYRRKRHTPDRCEVLLPPARLLHEASGSFRLFAAANVALGFRRLQAQHEISSIAVSFLNGYMP